MKEFLRARIVAKLDGMVARYQQLTAQSGDPNVLAQPERSANVQRELGRLSGTVTRYEAYRGVIEQLEQACALIAENDEEMAALAREELPELERSAAEFAGGILDSLLMQSGDNQRSAIVEVRAGTGGTEAALWARDLRDMYVRYAERRGWKVEAISESASEMGGIKESVFAVRGEGVFNVLRFESGGHRVQRVPATESQGRIHTSAATVAVLAEAEEIDVEIRDSDLEFQAVRASGPGGQNVNKVSSAVRITHVPSGLVVFCQEERSQAKNKAKALHLLRTRLLDQERRRVEGERAETRKIQVGTGDRSARIRTYNFPQNRLTDHRLGHNFSLEQVLEGKLEPVTEALLQSDREQQIEDL